MQIDPDEYRGVGIQFRPLQTVGVRAMQPNLGKLEEGKPRKPTHTPVNPGKCDVSLAGEVAALQELARPDPT